jgi:hypothetical protein
MYIYIYYCYLYNIKIINKCVLYIYIHIELALLYPDVGLHASHPRWTPAPETVASLSSAGSPVAEASIRRWAATGTKAWCNQVAAAAVWASPAVSGLRKLKGKRMPGNNGMFLLETWGPLGYNFFFQVTKLLMGCSMRANQIEARLPYMQSV